MVCTEIPSLSLGYLTFFGVNQKINLEFHTAFIL